MRCRTQALRFAEGRRYHALRNNCLGFADFVVRVLTGGRVKNAPLIFDCLVGEVSSKCKGSGKRSCGLGGTEGRRAQGGGRCACVSAGKAGNLHVHIPKGSLNRRPGARFIA